MQLKQVSNIQEKAKEFDRLMALIKDKTQEFSVYHTCDFMILPPHMPKNFRHMLYKILLTLRKCIADIWCNKGFSDLKACVHYFISIFYFSPNDSPSKTVKNAF